MVVAEGSVMWQSAAEGGTMSESATRANRVLCCALGVLVLVLADSMRTPDAVSLEPVFSQEMTVETLAAGNDLPSRELLQELREFNTCAWELPTNVDLKYLPVDKDHWLAALERACQKRRSSRANFAYALLVIWVSGALLLVLSRKQIRTVRLWILGAAVLVFGVVFAGVPNPMEAFVQFLKTLAGYESRAVAVALGLLILTALSLLGSKLVCGWACPLGALQELLFALPILGGKRKFKLPFAISVACRTVLLIAAIVYLFGVGTQASELSVYERINPFRIFEPSHMTGLIAAILAIVLLVSVVLFRPFCQILCPFGLYAWLVESFAANRPRLDAQRCTKCEECVKACPTQAMKGVYAGGSEFFRPGCWACGACVEACPEDAVAFTLDRTVIEPGAPDRPAA